MKSLNKLSKVFILIFTIIIATMLFCNNVTYARLSKTENVVLGLETASYGTGNRRIYNLTSSTAEMGNYYLTTQNNMKVASFRVVPKDSEDTNSGITNFNEMIYCLDNSKGFGASAHESHPENATYKMIANLTTTKRENIPSEYVNNVLPSGEDYVKMLLVLNTICNPRDGADADVNPGSNNEVDDQLLFDNIANDDGHTNYFEVSDFKTNNVVNLGNYAYANIIETIQQAAIWYVTMNGQLEFQPNDYPGFTFKKNDSSPEQSFNDAFYGSQTVNVPSELLYHYLTSSSGLLSQENISKFSEYLSYMQSSSGNYEFQISNTEAQAYADGNYTMVGPFSFNSLLDLKSVSFTDRGNPISDIKIYKNLSEEATGNTILDKLNGLQLVNGVKSFYVRVPATAKEIKIDMSTTIKSIYYYNVTDVNEIDVNQPIAVVENEDLNATVTTPINLKFDLALRKHIVKIERNGAVVFVDTENHRKPIINTPPEFSLDANNTTARKEHEKDPIKVQPGDVVTYEITVYNEGQLDATAITVTDYVPSGLTVTSTDWHKGETVNGYTAYTMDYGSLEKYTPEVIPSISKQIVCTVAAGSGTSNTNLKNVAEITHAENEQGTNDIDSQPDNCEHRSDYDAPQAEDGKGYQDDDDYEHLLLGVFDLALRKMIYSVNELPQTAQYNRAPTIDTSVRDGVNVTSFDYNFPNVEGSDKTDRTKKTEVQVRLGDVVYYNIRVYNEGDISGYAQLIQDDIPDGLEFLPNNEVNKAYDWVMLDQNGNVTNDVTEAVKIQTNHLSKEKSELFDALPPDYTPEKYPYYKGETNLLLAYNPAIMKDGPDSLFVTVAFKVVAKKNSSTGERIINSAEIVDDADENGNPIEDIDSHNPMTPEQPVEDDEDIEIIVPVKGVLFSKTTINGTKELPGAQLKVVDSNGRTVEEWTSTTQQKLIELEPGEYRMIETTAPRGYAVSEEIRFRITNEDEVEIYDATIDDWTNNPSKTVIMKDKCFDLALRKFIYKINGEELEESREPVITQADLKALAEGTASLDDGTTATKSHTKDKLEVKIGDTIEYIIRIYNEGDIDGYANKLLDDLGPGLEFKENSIINEQYGWYKPNSSPASHSQGEATLGANSLSEEHIIKAFNKTPNADGTYDELDYYDFHVECVVVKSSDKYAYRNVASIVSDINEGEEDIDDIDSTPENTNPNDDTYNPEAPTNGKGEEDDDDLEEVYVIPDNKITVVISKTTINGTEELPGATLKITNASGSTIKEWISTTTRTEVTLDPGEYTLTEITAPRGYSIAESIKFRVNNDGSVEIYDTTTNTWTNSPSKLVQMKDKCFDLALRKWVTKAMVIEDGVTKVKLTGHQPEDEPESVVKVELNQQRIDNAIIKFAYSIRITNQGDIEGYCTEISDYIPDGLKFIASDNTAYNWIEQNGKITTDYLKNTLLKPGEYADVEVVLTWVNSTNNLKLMVNEAEISDDYNEDDVPDIDSVPNNRKPKPEDDIDDAPVILTIVSGSAPSYLVLVLTVISIIVVGAITVKRTILDT